jgi:2-succinyl-5-enolpyruvyl-6-hydroxy-3-cyclohexene-1-carboxylate synthase
MNIDWSVKILEILHDQGVRDLVLCPGARNAPFIAQLAQSNGFELHSFFDERAAAFFALGLARRSGQPAAVITTSGTAVCELIPCAAEAFHTGVPLIFVTADRPKRLRGSGAPQAIDQAGLFTKFAGLEFDLEDGELFSLHSWNRRTPVHVNVCFDEPLLDEPIEPLSLSMHSALPSFAGLSCFASSAGVEWASLRITKFLRGLEAHTGSLLVVVGSLETDDEREAVAAFLVRAGAPVYLEATSGLRERAELQDLALRSGDKILSWSLRKGLVTSVLRIGGIPTARVWRDLDERDSAVDILSLSPLPFAGLSRGELVCAEIAPVLNGVAIKTTPAHLAAALYMKDRSNAEELELIFKSEPFSEPALVRALSLHIPESASVYIGNSLPIREWDLAATRERSFCVEANRGVNGIDGQVTTFLGLARREVENWAMIGDLTALYDLSAPWAMQGRDDITARIVVINNGGGKIFSRLFKTDLFLNRHAIGFEHWAKLWGLGYQRWTEVPEQSALMSKIEVIELVPDDVSTLSFWDRYDDLWT